MRSHLDRHIGLHGDMYMIQYMYYMIKSVNGLYQRSVVFYIYM